MIKYVGKFVSKTQFWQDISWRCALCGVNADRIWEMTLAEWVKNCLR